MESKLPRLSGSNGTDRSLTTMCKTIALLFAFLPAFAGAQTFTTSVRGTVVDSSGAIVPGAAVTIDSLSSGYHSTAKTDARGNYDFQQLQPSTYKITVSATGFGTQAKQAELLVDQPATVPFTLSVQATQEVVNVTAEAQTLNTTNAALGNSVSSAVIEALPMEGRNVPDLLSLQPGVLYLGRQINQQTDSRSGAVAGARSDQANVTLDGVDDNDQTNGFAFTGVLRSTIDSVQEFRVTTANADSDAGRSSGAQISLVTKSGTNHIHGSAYEYNRNTFTAANDWFNKQAELAGGEPNVPGTLNRNTYGGTVGGPIKTDHLFYFLNYEGQRTSENVQSTLAVPTPSLRLGNLTYISASQGNVTLTPTQIASMDPGCTACPQGAGVNPSSLALFNKYPVPNGNVLGDGFNIASYTWSAPNPATLNTYIAKLDWNVRSHQVFVRGNLQGDTTSGIPQFPGDPPSNSQVNTSKGIAAGDVWSISGSLINSFRYGYIWQGIANVGAGNGPYVDFVGFSSIEAENRTTIRDVPVNNFIDDFTWVKHEHTFQFGANYRLIHNFSSSNATSYSSADGNFSYFNNSGLANTGQSFDPAAFGFPAVANSFANSYNNAIIGVAGLVNDLNVTSNYAVSSNGQSGLLLNQGALINRDFKANEFEYYGQDSWRVRPNLTITFGLHQTLLQTPYEIHGQQVAPNISMYDWFKTRGAQAAIGNSDQPLFSFTPSGQSRGRTPYWGMQKANIAPRLAIVYSPSVNTGLLHVLVGSNNSSSIRAGFGMYYDHFGQGIVNSFSQIGSFSLTSTFTNAYYNPQSAPRFTGIHDLPPSLSPPPASMISYPNMPSDNTAGAGFQNTAAIDDRVKTPYSYAFNVSFQRELPHGFTMETAYVGRIGVHLMQQYDLGEPLDLVDPASGVDYFSAATQLSKLGYAGATDVAPIAYWEDLFPDAAKNGLSATQNIYNLWRTLLGNETFALYYLDVQCNPGCGGHPNRYWSPQYSSLFAWSSIGVANYNAGQITLRHPATHGVAVDFSYTLSKSLDLGSDAERTCQFCRGGIFSPMINTWNPRQNYAPSDFDTRHIVTADWVYNLPIGRGGYFLTDSKLGNAIFGGWQLSGLARWTSGLPIGILQSSNWSTNWTQVSWLMQTAPVAIHKHINGSGVPQLFADPSAIQSGYVTGSPVRNAFPGESGERNKYRGDGYFGIDSGLSKSWPIHEQQSIKFAWEVFNVTNSARFDVRSMNQDASSGGFGDYGALLTAPRVMQLSARYTF